MSGGIPIRCFTCGKVVGNMYDDYIAKCESGIDSSAVLDELKLRRECCRRMLATHVDVTKYQLLYPVYEDGVQRLGVSKYEDSDEDSQTAKTLISKPKFISLAEEDFEEGEEDPEGATEDLEEGEEDPDDDEETKKCIYLDDEYTTFSQEELSDIRSCIGQYIEPLTIENICAVISVFDKDASSKYLKTKTKPGTYTVAKRSMAQYSDQTIIRHIRNIWAVGLYPIEIIKEDQEFFFAVPQEAIFFRIIDSYPMLEAEENIPSIDDF